MTATHAVQLVALFGIAQHIPVKFGSSEFRYTRPLAEALRVNQKFRSWILG
ncbi:MAG: hypothetical protein OXI87_04675 [Albidovulum sp.]|nr:hypothetical protein [Albidovulum sp.]MDE0533480.1 hypothetical protein [Albidovulum sp.]